jgi:hypothetical protein
VWELHKVGARWLVESVRRDPASDAALPPAPQARASPEGVVKAALRALADSDTWQVSEPSQTHMACSLCPLLLRLQVSCSMETSPLNCTCCTC